MGDGGAPGGPGACEAAPDGAARAALLRLASYRISPCAAALCTAPLPPAAAPGPTSGRQCARARSVVDLAADQDTTDLQKCLACACRAVAAEPGRLGGARILAVGAPRRRGARGAGTRRGARVAGFSACCSPAASAARRGRAGCAAGDGARQLRSDTVRRRAAGGRGAAL